MTPVFADAVFYLAVVNPADTLHRRAVDVSRTLAAPTLTTAWVLTEVGNALSAPAQRPKFLRLLASLRNDPNCTILPASQELFDRGLGLYAQRPDKEWSLTDCISFAAMREHGITGSTHRRPSLCTGRFCHAYEAIAAGGQVIRRLGRLR